MSNNNSKFATMKDKIKLIIPIYSIYDSSKPPLYIKMARCFQEEYGFDLVAVTHGESSRRFLKKYKNIKWSATYDFQDFLLDFSARALDMEQARRLESEYGNPNFGMCFTAAEGLFYDYNKKYTYEETVKIISGVALFWEELFKKEGVSVFIDEGIASVNSIIWKIAQKRGARIFSLITARFPDRFAISHRAFDIWDESQRVFESIKKRNLSEKETVRAQAFLDDFARRKLEPPYMKLNKRPPVISPKAPLNFIIYLYQYYFLGGKDNIFFQSPYYRIKGKLERIFLYNALKTKNIWEKPAGGEKFVLFPLQYQPEASTQVLAPFYLDQAAVIENIARSLPVGCRLYVKEHVPCVGMRPVSFYRRILRIPNVRLISPWADTYQLIRDSLAVAAITSTVGWETILCGKPIILFGRVFYDIYDPIFKVEDIAKLPDIVKDAIESREPNKELLLKFITAILGSTYEGEIAMPMEYTYSDRNVENLCAAIAREAKGVYPGGPADQISI